MTDDLEDQVRAIVGLPTLSRPAGASRVTPDLQALVDRATATASDCACPTAAERLRLAMEQAARPRCPVHDGPVSGSTLPLNGDALANTLAAALGGTANAGRGFAIDDSDPLPPAAA